MIETGKRVSSPGTVRRLTPRAVRVRNGCLTALATVRSMPVPSSQDLANLGADVGLTDAWAWWTSQQRSAPRVLVSDPPSTPTAAWWRSRGVVWGILAASLLASAWVLRAQVRPSTPATVGTWLPVADTSLAHVNSLILRLGQTSASITVPLSAADVAALVLNSSLRRQPPSMTDLEARIDSLLSIRGTLADGRSAPLRFELRGRVHVVAAGKGRLDVVGFEVIGPPNGHASTRGAGASTPQQITNIPPIRFTLPNFVRDIVLSNGRATLLTRSR